MLGEYQPERVPLIFVHGMGDGPRRWQPAVELLDHNRFQPWVLYYPTGLRLEVVSNYFAGAVHELRRRHGFTQFAVVAHSMGGLVTRSFVQRLHAHFQEDEKALRIVITVNSPQGGMASANTGVEYSPIVIPAWQDVAAGREFLNALEERGWPKSIPYHLVFSYEGEKNGDGTVVLPSQIPVALQADGYVVTIQSLDGPARYDGRAVKDHIEFRRDGKTEAIRATGGKDTGMKWLLHKQRCLTVRAGEGYCRE